MEKQVQGGLSAMHPNEVIHHIRITLTGTKVSSLESVCNDLVNGAKQQKMKVKGPTRMPNKVLYVNTRRTPCGQGSKTWDRFQMRIHKRIIDVWSSTEIMKKITTVCVTSDIVIEVTIQ